jgi:hypothetical protein
MYNICHSLKLTSTLSPQTLTSDAGDFGFIDVIWSKERYSEVGQIPPETDLYSCLRHCALSRKIAGLFPDGVIGNFH